MLWTHSKGGIMLTSNQIRERIKKYCKLQDGSDLRDASKLEARICGLCEALGAKEDDINSGLSRLLLESLGIKVLSVNPKWKFLD